MSTEISKGGFEISKGSIDELLAAQEVVPELYGGRSEIQMIQRLCQAEHLILIARHNKQIAGFKVGYALDNTTFYSWLGGVAPDFRRKGLARLLAERQETWARIKGYKRVRLKTRNCFAAMLQFAIGSGFQIIEVDPRKIIKQNRIILEKELSNEQKR